MPSLKTTPPHSQAPYSSNSSISLDCSTWGFMDWTMVYPECTHKRLKTTTPFSLIDNCDLISWAKYHDLVSSALVTSAAGP
jgi:hypothetical protein